MKSRSAAFALAVALGMVIPGAVSAQLVGDRVRVTLSDTRWTVGVVTQIDPDELEISLSDGRSRVLAAGDVVRIERRTGQRHWKKGFMIGAAAGGMFALTFPVVTTGEDVSLGDYIGIRVILVSIAVPLHGAVGTLIGGLIKTEGWERLEGWPRSRVRPGLFVDMGAMPDGSPALRFGAKLRF